MKKIMIPVLFTLTIMSLYLQPVKAGNDIGLVSPSPAAGMDLATALQSRRSVRVFSDKDVPIDELSRILWAGYGITNSDGKRTVPTPWNRRMLKLYVFTAKGTYSYDAEKNVLKCINDEDARGKITAFTSSFAAKAPVVILITTDLAAGPFYAGKEEKVLNSAATAGASGQSMYLMATARGLGMCMIAGFDASAAQSILGLGNDELPLYIMPLGYPKNR